MKKNLLCLVSNIRAVALCLAVICSTIASWATPAKGNTFTIGDLKYTVTSVDPYECSVGKANRSITEAQIPETVSYDGVSLNVTSLSESAFYQCFSLSSITIPNSVISIGKGAFNSCTSLSSIEIPNGVTSIDDGVFFYCTALSSVTIPNSVTSIGTYAFNSCTSLSSITIPNGVISIGKGTFNLCTSLSSVTIPNSVTSIGEDAFCVCPLTQVTCKGTTPPGCYSSTFDNVDVTKCTLFVPKGYVDIYKSADVWQNFVYISPIKAWALNIVYNDDSVFSIDRTNVKRITFTEE